ncbi:hypothetical protein GZ77_24095 [Endozoicomonas montiporae]|uniref:Glycosyl transferase family 25 domain-containing protein n=2 Tax=Endozoicomonas montiporae TaxID=1027273 RepID=A0A081MZI5_9GAMM|nr:glycosyltransferase family 25 protein [Endozoicomonas montiporae]AMO54710.1 glycosyl transferase [Endozoicomonas montiporae CL-33]KEQ11608.1 hypothetical protein GZ77_24095 [Endozoicomonas montiporae]
MKSSATTLSSIPVFAICMEREQQRKIEISKHLAKLGVTFSFSNAVDGHQLTDEQKSIYSESHAKDHLGRPLALGEIGCYLSHTTIWQKIVDENIDVAFVIESDAVLSEETLKSCSALLQEKPYKDLIMVYYRECYPSFWQQKKITSHSKLVKFSNKSACTTAYLVSNKGAQKLLKHAFPISMPVDDFMTGGYINKDLDTYAVYPRNVEITEDALESSSIREDLFPLLKDLGIKRRLPNETNFLKEIEKSIRRLYKKLLPPPWL